MAKLLVQESAGVREFEIVDAEVHIGRELDNALRLSDPSISRHHAMIRQTSEGYEILDLQSSNGVLVNGSRVQTAVLQDGDRLTLGQIQITYVDPNAANAASSPLGTVRMNPTEMAKFQAQQAGKAGPLQTHPTGLPTNPSPTLEPTTPPFVTATGLTPPPPPPQPPMAPPPAPYRPPQAPLGGAAGNPAPAFLAKFLPPIPDNARPTGERGDFVTRLLASLIDGVTFGAPLLVLWLLSTLLFQIAPGLALALGCVLGLLQLALCLGYLILVPWCWIKFGATPGKKIMKLRVVPEDNPLGRIDVATAVLRMVGHLVNAILLCLPYLMIFGADRKGLQDIISKSLVIKVHD